MDRREIQHVETHVADRRQPADHVVERAVARGSSVAERGNISYQLAKSGLRPIGVQPQRRRVAHAKRMLIGRLHRRQRRVRQQQFDAACRIGASQCIEHRAAARPAAACRRVPPRRPACGGLPRSPASRLAGRVLGVQVVAERAPDIPPRFHRVAIRTDARRGEAALPSDRCRPVASARAARTRHRPGATATPRPAPHGRRRRCRPTRSTVSPTSRFTAKSPSGTQGEIASMPMRVALMSARFDRRDVQPVDDVGGARVGQHAHFAGLPAATPVLRRASTTCGSDRGRRRPAAAAALAANARRRRPGKVGIDQHQHGACRIARVRRIAAQQRRRRIGGRWSGRAAPPSTPSAADAFHQARWPRRCPRSDRRAPRPARPAMSAGDARAASNTRCVAYSKPIGTNMPLPPRRRRAARGDRPRADRSPAAAAHARRSAKDGSGEAMQGATRRSRSISSSSQGERPSHQATEAQTRSKPAPCSRATAPRSAPGVQASIRQSGAIVAQPRDQPAPQGRRAPGPAPGSGSRARRRGPAGRARSAHHANRPSAHLGVAGSAHRRHRGDAACGAGLARRRRSPC